MNIEQLTQSEQAALLNGLRYKRIVEAADMGVLYGESFAAALRVLGNSSDADKVEEMIKRVRNMTLEVRS